MPRLTLIEWGGQRHGSQAYKDRKFKFAEHTVGDLKAVLIEYYAGRILDPVREADIFVSRTKGSTAAPLEEDSFEGGAERLLADVWPSCVSAGGDLSWRENLGGLGDTLTLILGYLLSTKLYCDFSIKFTKK